MPRGAYDMSLDHNDANSIYEYSKLQSQEQERLTKEATEKTAKEATKKTAKDDTRKATRQKRLFAAAKAATNAKDQGSSAVIGEFKGRGYGEIPQRQLTAIAPKSKQESSG